MNALMLHAVGLARCGEWRLLDALEVEARASTEPTLAGILHVPGDFALLGYSKTDVPTEGDAQECAECEGDGELEVEGMAGGYKYIDCPWCHGHGYSDEREAAPRFEHGKVREWRNLRGAKVKGVVVNDSARWMDRTAARVIVSQYKPLVAKLAEAA